MAHTPECSLCEDEPAVDYVGCDVGGSITISPVGARCLKTGAPRDWDPVVRKAWDAALAKRRRTGTA